jgi:hypothetical protein
MLNNIKKEDLELTRLVSKSIAKLSQASQPNF